MYRPVPECLGPSPTTVPYPTLITLPPCAGKVDDQIQRYIGIKTLISAGVGFLVYLVLGVMLHIKLAHLFGTKLLQLCRLPVHKTGGWVVLLPLFMKSLVRLLRKWSCDSPPRHNDLLAELRSQRRPRDCHT